MEFTEVISRPYRFLFLAFENRNSHVAVAVAVVEAMVLDIGDKLANLRLER